MPEVFISYSTDAKAWAEILSASLESKGVSTWTDFKSVEPGQPWFQQLERGLDNAKFFLIVVGPKSTLGEQQDREWRGALERTWADPGKRILPILIDGAMPPSFLKAWGSVRLRAGKNDSKSLDLIYKTVRTGVSAPNRKSNTKREVGELAGRLANIEDFAKRMKPSKPE